MKVRRRKLQAFVLLFLSAFPVLVAVSFTALQFLIRWQMEEALEEENLTTLTITVNDLHWHKKGKEILYKGKLFDVKSVVETSPGFLSVSGIFDTDEDKLHEELAHHHTKQNSKAIKILQVLNAFVSSGPGESNLSISSTPLVAEYNVYLLAHLRLLTYPLTVPPPQA